METNYPSKVKKSSFCRRLSSIFLKSGSKSGDDSSSTTMDSNDSFCSPPSSPSKSFKEQFNLSRKKKFMTNYTLLEGADNISISESLRYYKASPHERCEFPVKSYSGCSQRGYTLTNQQRKNQDSLIMFEDLSTQSLVICCMDGHGACGDLISQYVKMGIEVKLTKHPKFGTNIQSAITETLAEIEAAFLQDSDINSEFSGTTMVLVVIRKNLMTIANIGDSRITLISKDERNQFIGQALSEDHKPEQITEKARITAAGGRVFPIIYPDGVIGPERVWLGDTDIPGLAMSRSMGDSIVHTVGVSSEPEFFEREFDRARDCAVVIATDGLWTVLTDNEVAQKAMSCKSPSSAIGLLIRESQKRWIASGDSVDDTTISICFLHQQQQQQQYR